MSDRDMADYDLAIIGGGINGTGIARDAAGRGLRVLLLEQSDLGAGTSSALTKLIPRGPAPSRAGRAAARPRGAHRGRGAAADGAAPDPADALHAAGDPGAALADHAADRVVPLRLARRPQNPAGRPWHRPDPPRH